MADFSNRNRWRPVEGYGLTYMVGRNGSVYRYSENDQEYTIQNPSVGTGGERYISMRNSGRRNCKGMVPVKKLVMDLYGGPSPSPKKDHIIVHLNGNKADNDITNLSWCRRYRMKDDKAHNETRIRWNPFCRRTGEKILKLHRQGLSYYEIEVLMNDSRISEYKITKLIRGQCGTYNKNGI